MSNRCWILYKRLREIQVKAGFLPKYSHARGLHQVTFEMPFIFTIECRNRITCFVKSEVHSESLNSFYLCKWWLNLGTFVCPLSKGKFWPDTFLGVFFWWWLRWLAQAEDEDDVKVNGSAAVLTTPMVCVWSPPLSLKGCSTAWVG